MTLTNEMNRALDLVITTNENLFITGKAGTGKTTFLQYLINNTSKNACVVAPSGIAAINAGGQTIHSFFSLPVGPYIPDSPLKFNAYKSRINVWQKMDLLIIDEISMVRADLLDEVDTRLRQYKDKNKPFGGCQVVMFGDLFQLPPVVTKDEEKILSTYYHDYNFYGAYVWKCVGFHVIELSHIFRQTDEEFISLLNNLRTYELTPENLEMLKELRSIKQALNFEDKSIHICGLRSDVEEINKRMLGIPTFEYTADIEREFSKSLYPAPETLQLRIGARVMTLVNDNRNHAYSNGSLGTVLDFTEDEDGNKFVVVEMDSGDVVKITQAKWSNNKYEVVNGKLVTEEVGVFSQFPLQLAWAITVHKSQGLTFDKIAIHLKYAFASGQLYVALSRCRSFEGIITDSFITNRMVIPDMKLIEFTKEYKANNNYYGYQGNQAFN